MEYKIYVDERDVNDATSYYIAIIKETIKINGNSCEIVYSLDQVLLTDIVVVIKVTSAFRVYRRNLKQRLIVWLQGIQPEEMLISSTPLFYKIFYYSALRLLEWFTLRKADLLLLVSDSMRRHYEKVYGYKKDNFFLMPCFNLALSEKAFYVKDKYTHPSFVYAGSLDNWQCFSEILQTYKHIRLLLPNATLTVFTAEQNKAEFECKEKYGLKDVVIKYIPQDRIQEELSQFKYGFILRKDISVNNVATPTKLNSYMSAGIIPIVSESLNDFINHSYLCKYIIRINNIEAFENNAVQIKKFEERKLNAVDVLDDFNKLFMSYYNKENYMNELSEVWSNYESNTFD